MMSKSFNRLTAEDPVCIQITTKYPLVKKSDRMALQKYFQEKICGNKVEIVDIAYETTSFVIDRLHSSEQFEKQIIYICFDKWIRGNRENHPPGDVDVSFTPLMNEMSECFANGGFLNGDSFLPPIVELDMSDWIISYFDSIPNTRKLMNE
jgi:hypothetical protein